MSNQVMVRAIGGQPLQRLVWKDGPDLIYICNPALWQEAERGRTCPVGFPPQDVFGFDDGLFEALTSAYLSGDQDSLRDLWSDARAYRNGAPDERG